MLLSIVTLSSKGGRAREEWGRHSGVKAGSPSAEKLTQVLVDKMTLGLWPSLPKTLLHLENRGQCLFCMVFIRTTNNWIDSA